MATMVSATNIVTPMLQELHAEVAITKRLLDCVPADKLTWKPHAKSMTLGQLAGHLGRAVIDCDDLATPAAVRADVPRFPCYFPCFQTKVSASPAARHRRS